MNARTKPAKSHRERQRTREMKRVDVTVPTMARDQEPSAAEVIDAGPDISGPEFDAVFEEIEQLRHARSTRY